MVKTINNNIENNIKNNYYFLRNKVILKFILELRII